MTLKMLVLIGWWVDLLLFCRRLRQEIIEENVNVSALAQLDISMIWPRVVLYSGEEASIYLATGVSNGGDTTNLAISTIPLRCIGE